jgi:hypothetical protein
VTGFRLIPIAEQWSFKCEECGRFSNTGLVSFSRNQATWGYLFCIDCLRKVALALLDEADKRS